MQPKQRGSRAAKRVRPDAEVVGPGAAWTQAFVLAGRVWGHGAAVGEKAASPPKVKGTKSFLPVKRKKFEIFLSKTDDSSLGGY